MLLENILAAPTHRRAHADLKLIEPLLLLLSALANDAKNEEVVSMYRSCGQMFEKTREVVERASATRDEGALVRAGNGYNERSEEGHIAKQGEQESLEEFLRRIEGVSAGYDDNDEMHGFQPEFQGDMGLGVSFPYLGAETLRMSTEPW